MGDSYSYLLRTAYTSGAAYIYTSIALHHALSRILRRTLRPPSQNEARALGSYAVTTSG